MAGFKVCPHCGSMMFAARISFPGAVQSLEDGTFKTVSEKKEGQITEIVMCARCRNEVTEDMLVEGVSCKECGKIVNPSDVDASGVCDVCKAKKERADLANASNEDLIKMIISMEKAARMRQAADTCPSYSVEPAEEPAPVADEEPVAAPASEADDEKKSARPKRRARRDATEDVAQAEEVTDTNASADNNADATAEEPAIDVKSEVNDLADLQEAPFPDPIAEDITGVSMETPAVPTSDVAGVSSFAMYESDESF